MLILTRRVGESLVADDDIVVTVLALKGNQVRIGVEAPRDRVIHRNEIYERLQGNDSQLSPGNIRNMDASIHR